MGQRKHVVSLVFNGVVGDSRVIKTAQSALRAGYDATLVGVSGSGDIEERVIEGVKVVLVPHHSKRLTREGIWGGERRDIRILVGSYIKEVLPVVVGLKPDLIHSHDMFCLKVGAMARTAVRSTGRNIPWIHDIHEFVAGLIGEQEQYLPHCLEWERNYLKTADRLICVSDALAQEVSTRYGLSAPTITYNAPYKDDFSELGPDIRSTLGIPKETPLVVFVGVASDLRGCGTIIEGIAKLDGVHLAFVSKNTAYLDRLILKATAAGASGRIHKLGYVPSHELTTFIRTADAGIHGLIHYPNAEVALPNKMFEYLHARLPLIVSDVRSMKEFVARHGVGQTFVAEDAGSCASAIASVLASREKYRDSITDELLSTYSWGEQERKIQQMYSELLAAERAMPSTDELAAAKVEVDRQNAEFEEIAARARTKVKRGHALVRKARTAVSLMRREGPVAVLRVAAKKVRRGPTKAPVQQTLAPENTVRDGRRKMSYDRLIANLQKEADFHSRQWEVYDIEDEGMNTLEGYLISRGVGSNPKAAD